jgi:MFS family permease
MMEGSLMSNLSSSDVASSVPPQSKKFFAKGWLMIFVAYCVAIVTQGIAISSFSMLRPHLAETIGVSAAEVAICFSIFVLTLAVVALAVGNAIERFGLRAVMIVAAIFYCGGFILQSFATTLSFLYFSTFIMGIGSAFGGVVVVTGIPANWFVKRRGFANGLMWTSSFFGTLICTNIIAFVTTDSSWQNAVVIIAIIAGAVLVISSFLLKWRPQDVGLLPDGMTREEAAEIAEKAGSAKIVGLTRRQALKTPTFWVMAVGILLVGLGEMGPTQSLPTLFIYNGQDLVTVAAWYSLVSFVGIFSKPLSGIVIDKFGAKWAFAVIEIMAAVGLIVLGFSTQDSTVFYMYAGLILLGLGENAATVVFSATTGKYLGVKYYAHIFALIWLFKCVGDSVGAPLVAGLSAGPIGYPGAFLIGAGASLLAAVVFFSAKKDKSLVALEERAATELTAENKAAKEASANG